MTSCLTIKANKPREEVFYTGVEGFNAMCCSMKALHAQLESETGMTPAEFSSSTVRP